MLLPRYCDVPRCNKFCHTPSLDFSMLQRTRIPAGKIKPQFLARELAVLAFNQRVLAQAEDRRVPALGRLRFLCIFSGNLDEVFEIRVAALKERIRLCKQIASPG